MNRTNFQEIAERRLRESKALLSAGFPDGSYYLAGYSVECALKACIAKRTQEHDFPDRKLAVESHTHDIAKLLALAELSLELEMAQRADPTMRVRVNTIQDWSEASRYERKTDQEARDLLEAIENPTRGLLPWIKQRW